MKTIKVDSKRVVSNPFLDAFRYIVIPFGLIVGLAVLLFVGGTHVYSYFVKNNYDEYFCTACVTVYSAAAGGVCTIIGAVIAFAFKRISKKARQRISMIPNFFIPVNLDKAKAIRLCFLKVESSSENSGGCSLKPTKIFNHNYYFRNTDKTPFIIDSLFLELKNTSLTETIEITGRKHRKTESINGVEYKGNNFYIDKGDCFCISLYSEEEPTDSFTLITKSIDKKTYMFKIDVANKTVI